MTTITKRFIALTDISGIRLECSNSQCNTSLLIADAQFQHLISSPTKLFFQCPNCGKSWTEENAPGKGSGFDPEIKLLLKQMEKVKELDGRMGCRLTFELKPDP